MFDSHIYKQRRDQLRKNVGSGKILLLGNSEASVNFKDNWYPFRQDSSFLYYTGINRADVHLIIDTESGLDTLYGDDLSIDDIVWTGPLPSLAELAALSGVNRTGTLKDLDASDLKYVHFLPPYRGEHILLLAQLTGLPVEEVHPNTSRHLIHAIIEQRNIKTDIELAEMSKAVDYSYDMHRAAMSATQPHIMESALVGKGYDIAYQHNVHLAYPAILTTRGEVLHNHDHHRVLKEGDMILCDMGCESEHHYAGDISRTWPVSGEWSSIQKEIYQVVLNAYQIAVEALRPGVLFADVHLIACKALAAGLTEIGLMTGDPEEAVKEGAHTMFFQCGLGHMIGLDVHDMENLGEDYVGYSSEVSRNHSFGFKSLRLGRKLEEGFAITIEPGVYIIPELIELRHSQGLYKDFINYDLLRQNAAIGGIRLEDNYVITSSGSKILGNTSLPLDLDSISNLVKT